MMQMRPVVSALLLLLAGCTGRSRLVGEAPRLRRPPQTPAPLRTAEAGPTLHLHYGRGGDPGSAIADFMYFVPLISPEPVTVSASAGNTQRARVLSARRRVAATSFSVVCQFEVEGTGSQQNAIDQTAHVRRHERKLRAGGSLARLLDYIRYEGPGRGRIEVDGMVADGIPTATEVRLVFNDGGRSPVTIGLKDIYYADGAYRSANEIVARVNALTFSRSADPPRMGVTVASVVRKDAGQNLWESIKGRVAGAIANLLIKPIHVEAVGNRAMLDFGLSLLLRDPTYTFPRAKNLTSL
ncbi:hypothetical protein HQ576_05075 [bacterium]|nr:hypothetical protein [bacterium]